MSLSKVRNTIKKYHLLKKRDRVIIGVSGGADSVCLLYLLNSLSKSQGIKLHIAHLDHMLRKESSQDRKFVETLANRLNIPITTAQVNLKEIIKETRGSIEEVARKLRLGFLFRVAQDIQADKIALGHNQDDQAETVLMRILRGSGLSGLSSISPKKSISGQVIIRPLIELSRREIQGYLKKNKLKFCIDSTNLEDIYFRNKIRNKLFPVLVKEYNPQIKQNLANMAESISADYAYLLKAGNSALLRASKQITKNKISFDLVKFTKLDLSLQRIALRLAISKVKGNLRRLTFKHMQEIEDLIENRPIGSIVDLPAGLCVVKNRKALIIYQKKQ